MVFGATDLPFAASYLPSEDNTEPCALEAQIRPAKFAVVLVCAGGFSAAFGTHLPGSKRPNIGFTS